MLNGTKPQVELGSRKCTNKPPREAIKGAWWNAEQNKNANNNYRQKKAKEKAIKWTSQIRKEPHENHSEMNRALQNAKNSKTTKIKFW